jgi:hypothetical protein
LFFILSLGEESGKRRKSIEKQQKSSNMPPEFSFAGASTLFGGKVTTGECKIQNKLVLFGSSEFPRLVNRFHFACQKRIS